MSQHRWDFGALDLVNADQNDGGGFWFETVADGFDLGSPEAVRIVLASLAADGDDERIQRHANRTVTFVVEVRAVDSEALGQGERALALEVGKVNTLSWSPPDSFGKTTVFDVRTSVMRFEMRDLELLRAVQTATYTVTLTCLPFARPVDPTTVSLTYGTATSGTPLRDGTSLTGVTATDSGRTPAMTLSTTTYLGDTAIKGTPAAPRLAGSDDPYDEYVFTGVTLSGSYLAVDFALDPGLGFRTDAYAFSAVASVPGMDPNPAAIEVLASGYRRAFFLHTLSGQTVTITTQVRLQRLGSPNSAASYVGGLSAWTSAPTTGLNVFEVEGSQRAPFSIKVSRGDAGDLGRVGVFSDPQMLASGYNPSVSGTWPSAPAGTYTVVVPAGGGGSNNLHGLTINGQTAYTRSSATGVPLFFEFHLGAARSGKLGTLTMSYTIAGTPNTVPTLWLFRKADDTALTFLNDVTYRYLWVDSPTLDTPHVGLWGGDASDGSDAVSVATEAYCADPMHIAPAVAALWVSTAVTGTTVDSEVTYYPRSHTFVA